MDNKFYCIANAYKALSVNNPINNKNGETTPGLKIFTYNQGNNMDFVFDGYVEKNLNIYVINYLSDATNVTVELEPLDNFIKLSETSFKFCDIESLYDEKISLKATLLDNCPWSEGYAYVLVKYKADNYEDFELMKLDIKTNQKTTFSKLSTKGDAPDFTDWTDIASADGSNFWCVGAGEEAYYGYLLKYNKVGGISASYLQTPAYDIEVINSSTAFVASNGRYDISKVSKTTNGGTSWTNCLTDSLTDFINQIHFYSATNGIFLGNPKDGKWCVASTTDAGETWQRYSSFEALSDEISYPKSNCFNFGDIYFGTSEGRLFFSEDAGAAWSVKTVLPGKEIHFVEFIDKNRGIIIYSNKGDASRQFIAKTNDGGNNWTTEIKSFSGDNKIINTFRPQDGDVIYVVNHKGEVFSSNNLFDSMQPILSKRTQQVAVNGLYAKSGKGTLLQFGDFITSLEFNYDKKDAKSDLSVVTSRDLNFGYVEPGTSSSQQVILLASGNQNSYISTSEIENVDCEDGEFSIESNFPINMNSGTYAAGIIKFTPNSKGLKTARLIINNNSEESRIVVNLKGAGDPISSVDGGVAIKKAISVFPNPAKEEVSFKFEIALLSETANVKINDIKGQNVLTFDNLQLNDKLITVDCSELNSGTYFADFEIGGKKYLTKFVISK
jgi:photosystem II stability/assembly factor-like uncharacterized protein